MKKIVLSMLAVVTVSGCSTLTGEGTSQNINVETVDAGTAERVLDAKCDLKNDEGTWTVRTPGTIMVHRSNKALQINCTKDGYVQDTASVESDTKANMWGNIIIGGGIGAIIDHNNGAAYDYPDVVRIPMKKGAFVDSTKATSPTN
jgi:uncharacterized protein YceK